MVHVFSTQTVAEFYRRRSNANLDKSDIAAEMLRQGYTVEDLIRIEKEALDSLRKKKTRRDPDAGAFVGSLF